MVQENASEIFSIIVISQLTLEEDVTLQKVHRKKENAMIHNGASVTVLLPL